MEGFSEEEWSPYLMFTLPLGFVLLKKLYVSDPSPFSVES
jgi:hypothetical protein